MSDWSQPGRLVADLLAAVEKLDTLGIKGPYEAVLTRRTIIIRICGRPVKAASIPPPNNSTLRSPKSTARRQSTVRRCFQPVEEISSITIGGDFTVGYRSHDDSSVHLFCVETVAAQLADTRKRSA